MKITHCIHNIDKISGGPSRSLPNLCKMLARRIEHISLVCYKTKDVNFSSLPENKVDLQLVDKEPSLISYLKSNAYLNVIKKKRPDVLHSHNLWSPCLHRMAVYARNNKIPYVISPRGCLEPWPLTQSAMKKKIALWIYQKNDLKGSACIHVTSRMEAEHIRKLGIKNPLAIIPNGVDIEQYKEKEYALLKKKRKKTVLFISRIHPKKGIHFLIDAWERLDSDIRAAWNLEIIGIPEDADYMEQIQTQSKRLNLTESIHFLPPVFGKEKIEKYQQADLFVLPTYSENFGMVIAEALACGTPVITTKGTPWESLNTNNCGWWIDLNVETLFQTLVKAVLIPEEDLVGMGKRGRILIEQTCSLEVVAERYVRMYEWIVKKTNKPDFIS